MKVKNTSEVSFMYFDFSNSNPKAECTLFLISNKK